MKKILSLTLVAALLASLLCACSVQEFLGMGQEVFVPVSTDHTKPKAEDIPEYDAGKILETKYFNIVMPNSWVGNYYAQVPEESGYNIAWNTNLTPYNALHNCEFLYVVEGCDSPAGARLFIRYVTGGADGQSGGLKPFSKEGNWAVRNDIVSDWNPVSLPDCGAIESDLAAIYNTFLDAQDMWIYWLAQNTSMN